MHVIDLIRSIDSNDVSVAISLFVAFRWTENCSNERCAFSGSIKHADFITRCSVSCTRSERHDIADARVHSSINRAIVRHYL